MEFSDTTNKDGIVQKIEFMLGMPDGAVSGDSTELAYFTSLINETYNEVFTEILASQDTWDFDDTNHTDYAIATTPLVDGVRDYRFDADLNALKIKRLDITYDGSNYYRSVAIDTGDFGDGLGDDDKIDEKFTKTAPRHDVLADAFWIYPRANATDVAAGAKMRMEFSRELDHFAVTDTTQEPGIDRPFHDLIPLGTSLKYAIMRGLESEKGLERLWMKRVNDLRNYYSRKQEDKDTIFATSLDLPNFS